MKLFVEGKYYLLMLVLIVAMSSCSQKTAPRAVINEVIPNVQSVNELNFDHFVTDFQGVAVVLFYNSQFWESKDMKERMDLFSHIYGDDIQFREYHWDMNNDGTKYALEMLPTVILYKQGNEVDRIKGIPGGQPDRLKWNRDIDLWFLKNAKSLKGNDHSGNYTYRFNNSSDLKINNF